MANCYCGAGTIYAHPFGTGRYCRDAKAPGDLPVGQQSKEAAIADMRVEVVKRELTQGALAGMGSEVSEYAARLVIAALDSFDAAALDEEFRRGFEAGEVNALLLAEVARVRADTLDDAATFWDERSEQVRRLPPENLGQSFQQYELSETYLGFAEWLRSRAADAREHAVAPAESVVGALPAHGADQPFPEAWRLLYDTYREMNCTVAVDPTDPEDCANVAAESIRVLAAAGWLRTGSCSPSPVGALPEDEGTRQEGLT